MAIPHITTFCWCMGLEAGTKLIGYIHLLVSLVNVGVCSAAAGSARSMAAAGEDPDLVYSRLATAAIVVAAFSVVHVALAALLLIAAHKRNASCLRAYVWVMCVLWAAALVYALVCALAFKPHYSGSDMFLAFLEGVLFFGITAYCILCVNSYYLVLRACHNEEGIKVMQY